MKCSTPLPFGHLGDHAGRHQVDLDGQLFVQRAGRVADDPAQVDDRVDLAHGLHHFVDLAEIGLDNLQVRMIQPRLDRLGAVQQQIEQADVVALLQQLGQQG